MDRWLYWEEEDIGVVTTILGDMEASKGRTSENLSFLHRAEKRGIELTNDLQDAVDLAREFRHKWYPLRHALEADVPEGLYPKKLVQRLWGHQRACLAFMEPLSSYLNADQPGVGKTAPSIMWSCERAPRGNVLVVTPGRARWQWLRMVKRWGFDIRRARVVEGRIPEQRRTIKKTRGWVIAHWEALVHAGDAIIDRDWDAIIFDEGHAIRNRNALRTLTAHQIVRCPNKLILTADPWKNTPEEIWSLLHFLYPHRYPSFWRFTSMHVRYQTTMWGIKPQGARQPKLLRWELGEFTIRRKKTKVFPNLPPITREAVHVELGPKARREYERLCKQMFVELRGRKKPLPVFSVLARTTRIRQYLVDPGLLGSKTKPQKYRVVNELMDDLDGPPVIFTMFRKAAVRLQSYLADHGKTTELLVGGSGRSKKKRHESDQAQMRFLRGKLDALIVTIQAGGHALNLGKYGYVILLDLPWSAADLEQAEGRVDRPEELTGALVPTTAYRIITRGTYELKMEEKLVKKKWRFDEVFEVGEIERLFAA